MLTRRHLKILTFLGVVLCLIVVPLWAEAQSTGGSFGGGDFGGGSSSGGGSYSSSDDSDLFGLLFWIVLDVLPFPYNVYAVVVLLAAFFSGQLFKSHKAKRPDQKSTPPSDSDDPPSAFR